LAMLLLTNSAYSSVLCSSYYDPSDGTFQNCPAVASYHLMYQYVTEVSQTTFQFVLTDCNCFHNERQKGVRHTNTIIRSVYVNLAH